MQVRDAAISALDGWVSAIPAEKVIPAVADFLSGSKASSEGKTLGLKWINSVVASRKAHRGVDGVLRAVAVGTADKAVEVREAAATLAGTVSQVGLQCPASVHVMALQRIVNVAKSDRSVVADDFLLGAGAGLHKGVSGLRSAKLV